MKLLTGACILATCSAHHVRFRPPPGTAPWKVNEKRVPYEVPDFPTGYFVPDFGVDQDIKLTKMNLDKAEKQVGHSMKASFKKPAPPADLRRPDYGVDSEILSVHNSLGAAEKKMGKKFKLMQLESDPICSSAGCSQYKHKKAKLGYPIDYPVPSFGKDPEIEANANSLSIAEAMHRHNLIMGTPESRAKWHNVAKDTEYNFAPELDEDMKNTASHLGVAEGIRNHKWTIA